MFIATAPQLPLFKPSVAVTFFSATQWNGGFHLCLPTSGSNGGEAANAGVLGCGEFHISTWLKLIRFQQAPLS